MIPRKLKGRVPDDAKLRCITGWKPGMPKLCMAWVFDDRLSPTGMMAYLKDADGQRGCVHYGKVDQPEAWVGPPRPHDVLDSGETGLCPVCGEVVKLDGLCKPMDNDGNHFLHATCGDGFPAEKWFEE